MDINVSWKKDPLNPRVKCINGTKLITRAQNGKIKKKQHKLKKIIRDAGEKKMLINFINCNEKKLHQNRKTAHREIRNLKRLNSKWNSYSFSGKSHNVTASLFSFLFQFSCSCNSAIAWRNKKRFRLSFGIRRTPVFFARLSAHSFVCCFWRARARVLFCVRSQVIHP